METFGVANSGKPFEWMAWGGMQAPTEEQLRQMLDREGLSSELQDIVPGKTQEMRFEKLVVWVLVKGSGYFGIPGYGSVDMNPGDIMEIEPGFLHDITVTSGENAQFLKAFRT